MEGTFYYHTLSQLHVLNVQIIGFQPRDGLPNLSHTLSDPSDTHLDLSEALRGLFQGLRDSLELCLPLLDPFHILRLSRASQP